MNAASDLLNSTLSTTDDSSLSKNIQILFQQLFASAVASVSAFLALVVLVLLRLFRAHVTKVVRGIRDSLSSLRRTPPASTSVSRQTSAPQQSSTSETPVASGYVELSVESKVVDQVLAAVRSELKTAVEAAAKSSAAASAAAGTNAAEETAASVETQAAAEATPPRRKSHRHRRASFQEANIQSPKSAPASH